MGAGRTRFSLYQFHCFLKLAGQDHLVDRNTLGLWSEAAREFGPIFNFREAQDLRCVDVSRVSQRYIRSLIDMHTHIAPRRVLKMQSHLRAALGDFIAFAVNPARYRESTHAAMDMQAEIVAA